MNTQFFSAKDQVQLLLVEYKTLRAEILRRSSWQNQMWIVAVAQVVVILGFVIVYDHIFAGVIVILISMLPFAFGLLYNVQDIRIIAAHLRTLEARNQCASGDRAFLLGTQGGGIASDRLPRASEATVFGAAKSKLGHYRRGNPLDNAPMESFFASLKTEEVHLARYRTRAEAKAAVFEYLEIFYNRVRLHSGLGYRTPAEARASMQGVAMRAAA